MMLLAKPARPRSEKHRRWVASLPCCVPQCGRRNVQAHHLGCSPVPKARGLRPGDDWCVPVCVQHHDPNHQGSIHHDGGERAWWERKGLDPIAIAEKLWAASVAAGRA